MKRDFSTVLSCFPTLFAASILLCTISGCRVGDHVEAQPNPDQYTGYYVTSPQNLTFYVTTSDTRHGTAPISQIPSMISQVMTNPVAFIIQDLSTGYSALSSPKGDYALPIYLNTDQSISYSTTTQDSTFWTDPACQSHIEFSEQGKLLPNPSIASPSGNTHSLMGGLQVTFQVLTVFKGNCTPTFQSIVNCYSDVTQCGGTSPSDNQNLQNAVINTFSPMVQAHLIQMADLPKVVNYAYEVTYE